MLVEAAFASLVFMAWRKVKGRKGMTQERRDVYLAALENIANPKDLRTLAEGFEKDGLPIEASMLRKRADLRQMCQDQPEKWERYRALSEQAVAKPDSNPQALDDMAAAFDAMTANGTAAKLRRRAAERRAEILAFAAQEEERKKHEEFERAKAAVEALAKQDAEEDSKKEAAPETPRNSGVAEVPDPEKTIDPAQQVSP